METNSDGEAATSPLVDTLRTAVLALLLFCAALVACALVAFASLGSSMLGEGGPPPPVGLDWALAAAMQLGLVSAVAIPVLAGTLTYHRRTHRRLGLLAALLVLPGFGGMGWLAGLMVSMLLLAHAHRDVAALVTVVCAAGGVLAGVPFMHRYDQRLSAQPA